MASRGEFNLAGKFREIKKNDFRNIEKRRKYHIKIIDTSTKESSKSKIVEFDLIKIHVYIKIHLKVLALIFLFFQV